MYIEELRRELPKDTRGKILPFLDKDAGNMLTAGGVLTPTRLLLEQFASPCFKDRTAVDEPPVKQGFDLRVFTDPFSQQLPPVAALPVKPVRDLVSGLTYTDQAVKLLTHLLGLPRSHL